MGIPLNNLFLKCFDVVVGIEPRWAAVLAAATACARCRRRCRVLFFQAGKRFAARQEVLRKHEETEKRLAALRKDQQRAATIIQVSLLQSLLNLFKVTTNTFKDRVEM